MFIFGGSATYGVEAAGFHVDQILEMTDDMHLKNAYHFTQNRPDVNITPPSDWENTRYLQNLRTANLDLLYSNCPCSSLSRINRNASLNGEHNRQFYRVFNVIEQVQPKAFFIENAPALVKLGYPIIMNMVKQLGSRYRFTVIRDFAGNHNVAMKRLRTLLVGYRRDVIDGLPILEPRRQAPITIQQLLGDLWDVPLGTGVLNGVPLYNHELVGERLWQPYEKWLNDVEVDDTLLRTILNHWETVPSELQTFVPYGNMFIRANDKIQQGQDIWDKSPYRPRGDDYAPSITSLTHLIHPVHPRQWTIREYARLMGYPDDFQFYPDGAATPTLTCIAQGVPARFVEYIATEVRAVLNNQRPLLKIREPLCFQHHTQGFYRPYTLDELYQEVELEYHSGDPYCYPFN